MEGKHNAVKSQPPLVVIMSTHAKRTCSFYNMVDGKRFKTMLPRFAGKLCSGSSCGYLIMQGRNEVWFVNPFTRHELHFPGLPTLADHIILTSSNMQSDFISVAVYRYYSYIKFCRFRDTNWTTFSYANQAWIIVDVAVFKGKLYAVTNDARIGIISLNHQPSFNFLQVSSVPTWTPFVMLAASDDELMMLDFRGRHKLSVYVLDLIKMEWVRTVNLGDNALFVSDMKCTAIHKTICWGGRSNCVYHVGSVFEMGTSFSLDGELLDRFPIARVDVMTLYVKPFLWYFPHEMYSVNALAADCYDS